MSNRPLFRLLPAALVFLFIASLKTAQASELQKLTDTYIETWAAFYPSKALSEGLKTAAFEFEDISGAKIENWLKYNRQVAAAIEAKAAGLPLQQRINARVLQRQIKRELEFWAYDKVQINQPIWYAELISQALTYLLVGEQLTAAERARALEQRLRGIDRLCSFAIATLRNGSPERTRRSLQILERTRQFYQNSLPQLTRDWVDAGRHEQLADAIRHSAGQIDKLSQHIRLGVLPKATLSDYFGAEAYTRKLQVETGSELTPVQLAERAGREIDTVRALMVAEARRWWQHSRRGHQPPATEAALLQAAIEAMERDREANRGDFLQLFIRLTREAEAFVIEHDLASVPQPRTLYIGLSPDHFSGAAYGGVYPAGPFDPQAQTLFYLPSVPDDTPQAQKIGFYRSFNNPFNTMIIAHEMFPGHYMQYKIAVNDAPPLRSLYADGIYVEGWGTFSEKLMLDAGWGGGQVLVRLAHLRKRLENATRAYTSAKVHTQNWSREQLMHFATTRGLLAPQFATNLWHRVINNPLQITSYFLGFHSFERLWAAEQRRLGDKFNGKHFVDAVLRTGPVPMDVLGEAIR